ncbi:MAG: mechanosensitive ion channel, partial [bacterium]|nr:mechanosensitive ion channel [bacterium]
LTLLGNLFYRWYALRTLAAAFGGVGSSMTASQSGITRAASASVQEEQLQADAQVRGFFRFAVIVVAAVGTVMIWTAVIPSLYMFKRIEIWPDLAWRQVEIDNLAGLPATADASGPAPGASQESAPGEALPGIPGTVPSSGSETPAEDQSAPITLWILGKAIIMALVTFSLVRDMPGLLDLAFLRRTRMDPGARIAVITLVRYTIAILGSVATFQTLGISWSKVQWLAAALTFGLGFGLQEIVANFVSGLILLAERPIRVGDAVSIGNLSGLVTKIRIRSTTISMWDRSEMIVPNKEFVTQKLINWTLSDNRTRVDIPVRVAYGSDIQHVKDVLLKVGSDHPATMDEPTPKAILVEFGEAAVHLELRVFVDYGFGRVKARDELQMAIDKAFR